MFKKVFRIECACVITALLSACNAQGQSNLASLSPSNYLAEAITLIEKKALRSPRVDWKAVKTKSFEMITGAKSTDDTYAAINYVLSKNFARLIQQEISEVAGQKPVGWIVDLRENTGGNVWPMLVGVGPLIGGGILGFFEYPNVSMAWFYDNGASGVINKAGKHTNFKLDNGIADLPNAPLVVLTDGATASSGEALAISFKERPNTCFIGTHTSGLSTNNENTKLADGATLYLTTSGESDRNHVFYNAGIAPEITVEQGDIELGAEHDPGFKAAMTWLKNHNHLNR
jgi:C-terminal processing protease CtpA/Prc